MIDRFGDVFVLQTNTAGMERLQDTIIEALEKLFSPRAVIILDAIEKLTAEEVERRRPC